jgi:hypothetical protein
MAECLISVNNTMPFIVFIRESQNLKQVRIP